MDVDSSFQCTKPASHLSTTLSCHQQTTAPDHHQMIPSLYNCTTTTGHTDTDYSIWSSNATPRHHGTQWYNRPMRHDHLSPRQPDYTDRHQIDNSPTSVYDGEDENPILHTNLIWWSKSSLVRVIGAQLSFIHAKVRRAFAHISAIASSQSGNTICHNYSPWLLWRWTNFIHSRLTLRLNSSALRLQRSPTSGWCYHLEFPQPHGYSHALPSQSSAIYIPRGLPFTSMTAWWTIIFTAKWAGSAMSSSQNSFWPSHGASAEGIINKKLSPESPAYQPTTRDL